MPYLPEVVVSSTGPLLLVTRRVPGTSLFAVADSIDRDQAGRPLSVERIMAWHVRQALGDVRWRTDAGIHLADHRTPPDWVDDLAARFRALGLDP